MSKGKGYSYPSKGKGYSSSMMGKSMMGMMGMMGKHRRAMEVRMQ